MLSTNKIDWITYVHKKYICSNKNEKQKSNIQIVGEAKSTNDKLTNT